ncbi:MAG: insulinase family protein [Patescibacteria group bacterium]|jgi:predicted Zn-dependent peptidase|nr:insulinase family protein [Patescibacteria group bacterium]
MGRKIKMKKNNQPTILKKEGLNFLLIPLKEATSVTFLILVKTGSEYEKPNEAGISHFLEHMCFKGTKNRPSPKIISTELDSIGAVYNAFTSREYTGYYAKAAAEHTDKILDIVTDIYLNSLFDSNEIEKEKGVILEEKNYYEDTPSVKIEELIFELLYPKQAAGRPIIGDEKVIKNLKRENFLDYHKKHYTNEKTLIVLAGNFEKEKIIKKIVNLMKDILRGKGGEKFKTIIKKQVEPQVLIHNKKTDQTHLILAARTFNCFDERRYALSVLSTILGSGMSSRLFQVIREELGAAYYVYSFNDLSLDHGFLGIAAGLALDKTEKSLMAIKKELDKLSNELVGDEELKKAKSFIKGKLALSLETTNDYAFYYGSQHLFYGQTFSLREIFNKIDAVDKLTINKLARVIFQPKSLNLALIGPYDQKDKMRFKKMLI